MPSNLTSFWKRQPKDIIDVSESAINISSTGLAFGVALGILNPVLAVPAAGLACVSPVKKVLEYFGKKKNKTSLEEFVAIAAPVAYFQSFDDYVSRNSIYQKRLAGKANLAQQVDSRIEGLELTETLATNVLTNYARSELVLTFNDVLASLLERRGWDKTEIKITTNWVAWQGGRYLKEEIKKLPTDVSLKRQNLKLYPIQKDEDSSHHSILEYLSREISV